MKRDKQDKQDKKLRVKQQIVSEQTKEISEQELEQVAGGGWGIRCSFELTLIGGTF